MPFDGTKQPYRIPSADELPETTSGKLWALAEFAREVIDPERFDYSTVLGKGQCIGCLLAWGDHMDARHLLNHAKDAGRPDADYIFNVYRDAPDNSLSTAIARIEEVARKYEGMGR